MKYDWEKKIEAVLDDISMALPRGFNLIGVAVENITQGEAALVEYEEEDGDVVQGDVTAADIRQDILSDANRQYNRVSGLVFEGKKP